MAENKANDPLNIDLGQSQAVSKPIVPSQPSQSQAQKPIVQPFAQSPNSTHPSQAARVAVQPKPIMPQAVSPQVPQKVVVAPQGLPPQVSVAKVIPGVLP